MQGIGGQKNYDVTLNTINKNYQLQKLNVVKVLQGGSMSFDEGRGGVTCASTNTKTWGKNSQNSHLGNSE